MMKKRLLSLLLCAALLLSMLPGALAEAEHIPYIPGALTQTRFAEAFKSGNAICADMGLSLALNAETLGLTGEEADAVNAVLKAIENAQLSVAAVKIEDGVILELSGAYFGEEDAYASLDAQLEITKTGLALTSDTLIPGERVSVTWETVLAMLGLDETTSAQVLALRSMSLEEIRTVIDSALSLAGFAAKMTAAPYAQILSDFAEGLPVAAEENVAADGIFPAAAMQTTVTVTEKATGELIAALCDVLEADTTLAPMIDAYFAANADPNEAPITTASLCAALREEAAVMTDETYPAQIVEGFDAAGCLLYISVSQTEADGSVIAFNWVNTAAAPEETAFHLEAFTADAQEVYDGLTLDLQYIGDPDDPNVADLHLASRVQAGEQMPFSASLDLSLAPGVTDDGMSGYISEYTCTIALDDGEEILSTSMEGEAQTMLTPEGGEFTYSSYTTETQTDGVSIQQTVQETLHLMEDENGPLVEYSELLAMPQMGLDEMFVYAQVYTLPYAPEGTITELALESASEEELNALLGRALTNAQGQLETLMGLLPEELLALMEPAEEPATPDEAATPAEAE